MLTRDEVIWGFRYCLGSDPESENAIRSHWNFRNWGELREALRRFPEFVRNAAAAEMASDPISRGDRLIFGPDHFSYLDPYAGDGEHAIRCNGVIEYDVGRHGEIDEPVLFFGPYICLDPGVYLFRFNGNLQGQLRVRFAHRCGVPIKEVTLENFREPLCLVLRQEVTDFEVVAGKTPALRSLQIETIIVDRIGSDRYSGEDAGKVSALSPVS